MTERVSRAAFVSLAIGFTLIFGGIPPSWWPIYALGLLIAAMLFIAWGTFRR